MWPPKLRDHQADGYDVEQKETTPWLQHTGWPRLFHNRPLGIIAATARKPKPAWNEDYLLGQWHDTALRSPAVVEAQLRVILRGVDIMVDRACFTLAKTSYRSRCWLNTYWKDTFWPHEFKAVNCLKRYVDEAESSNWEEGREDEEDEPGDCDDGDEYEDGDDDGGGADEEYINEYDRVETENHFNENSIYNDMSDEDELSVNSTFSLPSGLWLHLSEAIFQLSMMFWTYQEPTGDMSASIIIQYAAVLGIQGSSLAFHPAHSSSPRLAALIWIGRLLFLEYAVPVSAYNTLDIVRPSLTAYPSQPDRISSIRCKYLLRGCYTPFGELIELKAFAKYIVKREGVPGNLTWAPDGRSFTIGDDKKSCCQSSVRPITKP
ncbi:hypothetical protein V3481_019296 [Fusarium oxysporum f. sp. vasinfectum]